MTRLGSFDENISVALIGASGGIGQAFCKLLTDDSRVKSVYALSRSSSKFSHDKIRTQTINIEDEKSVKAAADALGEVEFDMVLVLSGILHQKNGMQPERRLREITEENLRKAFSVNAIGPALVAKYFVPKLKRGKKSVFAALSARVGSIEDNRLGGWHSYRSSKAALNQYP